MTLLSSILAFVGCGKTDSAPSSSNRSKSTDVRIALIGEISGNIQALNAVLDDIESKGIARIYCLGGVAGYGANPNECITALRDNGIKSVRSFFDDCLNGYEIELAQDYIKESLRWTNAELTPGNKEWIRSLPYTLEVEGALLCNSDFYKPEEHGYLDRVATVQRSFEALNAQGYSVGFLAHSHVSASFFLEDPITYSLDQSVEYSEFKSSIMNVGSVGQPRDDNPKSCYAIWHPDTKKVEWIRVRYDIKGAQEAIRAAGLPDHLATRLQHGQ